VIVDARLYNVEEYLAILTSNRLSTANLISDTEVEIRRDIMGHESTYQRHLFGGKNKRVSKTVQNNAGLEGEKDKTKRRRIEMQL
jgi:hypothetical protein